MSGGPGCLLDSRSTVCIIAGIFIILLYGRFTYSVWCQHNKLQQQVDDIRSSDIFNKLTHATSRIYARQYASQVTYCNIVYPAQVEEYGNYSCVPLSVTPTTPICPHPPQNKTLVLRFKPAYLGNTTAPVTSKADFEDRLLHAIHNMLKETPGVGFIDVGAGTGAYSLAAAKLGRQIVAVDPYMDNIRRVTKAIQLGHLENTTVVLHNAVSDTRKLLYVCTSSTAIGAMTLVRNKDECPGVCAENVTTILLDDIFEVTHFRSAILKIATEGNIGDFFANAKVLFDQINILAVYMDCTNLVRYYQVSETSQVEMVLKFFQTRNFVPYYTNDVSLSKPLVIKDWKQWSQTYIVWRRVNH